jgi:hypothetical protein
MCHLVRPIRKSNNRTAVHKNVLNDDIGRDLFFVYVNVLTDQVSGNLDQPLYVATKHDRAGYISCVDPATDQFLGHVKDFTAAEV